MEARLCRTLSTADWRCAPAGTPAAPGALSFYTRITSPRATTVLHQWYFEGMLLRTVRLDIAANQAAGFRTYSRNTIIPERAGQWRIDVRTTDGDLIHQERFEIRAR